MISHDDKAIHQCSLPSTTGMIDAIACKSCRERPPPDDDTIVGIVGHNLERTAITAATRHDDTQAIIGDGRAIKPFTLGGR